MLEGVLCLLLHMVIKGAQKVDKKLGLKYIHVLNLKIMIINCLILGIKMGRQK